MAENENNEAVAENQESQSTGAEGQEANGQEQSKPLGEGEQQGDKPSLAVSTSQSVADMIENQEASEEGNESTDSDESSEGEDKAEGEGEEKEGEAEDTRTDAEKADDAEIDSLVEEVLAEGDEGEESADNKDGFKKGIEKVKGERDEARAENIELKERLARIEGRLDERDKDKGKEAVSDVLSDEELDEAISKSMEENDSKGLRDVFDYMLDQSKKSLREEYRTEQKTAIEKVAKKQGEWQTILKDYSATSYDNVIIAADADFDISKDSSLLYRLSEKIYTKGIAAKDARYTRDGGMRSAVDDAFIKLLKNITGKAKSKTDPKKGKDSTDGLKNRLTKELKKSAQKTGASSSGGEQKAGSKEYNSQSELDEVLSERSEEKNARMAA